MNKKGEINVGVIIIIAVALIVGAIFFQTIAQQVGTMTNTIAVENESLTDAAADGTALYLTSYRGISSVSVFNATGDVPVPADNYTVANNVVHPTTGDLTVSVTPTTITADNNGVWTVDGVGQPLTYVTDSGSRAVVNLIILMFALALIAAALYPVYSSRLLEMFGR